MNEIQKKVLLYILKQTQNRFDEPVPIKLPDENIIEDEAFGRAVVALSHQGYFNGFRVLVKNEVEGLVIRQVIINVSRQSQPLTKGGMSSN